MSYIDCRDHSFVGTMFGLPVYHPLGDYDEDFVANPTNFVIGGGGGEHPGMVVQSLDGCVLRYLSFCYDNEDKEVPDWLAELIHEVWEIHPDLLIQYGWSMENTINFGTKAKAKFKDAFDVKREIHSIESMIEIMIGEFAFYSAHQMLTPIVLNHILGFNREGLFSGLFEAINVPPKGYPVFGRRTAKTDDVKGGAPVTWGLRFDEE